MKTPISYYGGKQTMLHHILPLIPKHNIYTEVFCGGCSVFFAKTPAECEIINDTNGELINFYTIAKTQFNELKQQINKTLHSRDTHVHAGHIYQYSWFFTPVERAWAVWYLSKSSFASRFDSSFGYDRDDSTAKKIYNARLNFDEKLTDRLSRTTIESRDALHVIKCYDKINAFHFIDPPYVGTNRGHYTDSFSNGDLTNLLNILTGIKGKFMLTMFPNEIIKQYANDNKWTVHKIQRTISASLSSRRKQEEWIVCNY